VKTEEMRLLSLWQPWAMFVRLLYKRWETRSWSTPYRGLIAIHAAKTKDHLGQFEKLCREAGIDDMPKPYPVFHYGAIIAVCDLTDCVPTVDVRDQLLQQEKTLGIYSAGRFAWKLENVRPLNPPLDYRGAMGLTRLPADVVKQVMGRVSVYDPRTGSGNDLREEGRALPAST